jgi:hypothetical protein
MAASGSRPFDKSPDPQFIITHHFSMLYILFLQFLVLYAKILAVAHLKTGRAKQNNDVTFHKCDSGLI